MKRACHEGFAQLEQVDQVRARIERRLTLGLISGVVWQHSVSVGVILAVAFLLSWSRTGIYIPQLDGA